MHPLMAIGAARYVGRRVAWLAIRVAGVSFVLAGTVVGSGLRAQAPKRLPAVAGEDRCICRKVFACGNLT
jgi:hypothetical protein